MTSPQPSRGNLGPRTAIGVLSQDNRITPGGWVVTFPIELLPYAEKMEVWHGVAIGPGGYFRTFLDYTPYGVGANGKINEYAPSIPMYITRGQVITLHWSISTPPAPEVTLYFRTPEVGRIG